mgnify:CR=1 FL=1
MNNQNYGSVITEQGDLGLGVIPIVESASKNKDDKKEKDEKKGNKK